MDKCCKHRMCLHSAVNGNINQSQWLDPHKMMNASFIRRPQTPSLCALGLCVQALCLDAGLKTADPQKSRNGRSNQHPPLCLLFFLAREHTHSFPKYSTHIYIYLLRGNDTEQTTEEAIEDQGKHKDSLRKGLFVSCSSYLSETILNHTPLNISALK